MEGTAKSHNSTSQHVIVHEYTETITTPLQVTLLFTFSYVMTSHVSSSLVIVVLGILKCIIKKASVCPSINVTTLALSFHSTKRSLLSVIKALRTHMETYVNDKREVTLMEGFMLPYRYSNLNY